MNLFKKNTNLKCVLVYKSGVQYCGNPPVKQAFTDTRVSQKATC